ncbi:T9SS type A sorting domain-containing protein [Spirosoma sp. HMF3257]|uniref:T9SS type A sorting domain-containing protein n=1 Tax=Spirosoma telluris TaxID=2183553 RepID=A0A327NG32_9BACT|nr:T9SS type A sorting domain-containing protein [Spirosoma telluris]RAI73219.1 hypothetical protein HMF3257_00150 [Spirosoma telluris]
MNAVIIRLWLAVLTVMLSLATLKGQTITLSNVDPNGSPDDAFDGTIFQSGNQYGDANIYAILSGGAKSFQIVSPGESLTKTISSTGYFTIRTASNMVVDKSKILNFSGTVTGSVAITIKPLSVTTLSANVSSETTPGSELTVSYQTGAGTFPPELIVGKFKVQLLDANGNLLSDLLNSADQYTGAEKVNSSRGNIRFIKATIPVFTPAGTYRVRVITQGLTTQVIGSTSGQFTIRDNPPIIGNNGVSSSSFCAGTTVSFPFSTTGVFPSGNLFKVRLIDGSGTILQDLVETSATTPVRAILPSTLANGSYRFLIASTSTNVVSSTSTINITALPTMSLSGSSSNIAGSQAAVQVKFTGTPPWSVDFTDYRSDVAPNYVRTITTSASSTSINPTLFFTSTYDKSFIKGFKDSGCGTSTAINGSSQIIVTPLVITTGSLSGTYCPGSVITVPFTTNSQLPTDAICQVQLSDSNGSFQNGTIIGTGSRTSPISATLSQSLTPGAGYRLLIIVQKPTSQSGIDYNDAINSTSGTLIVNRPDAPKVTDLYFCSGTVLSPLTATGTNLKWYSEVNEQPLSGTPTPLNDRSSRYFVSQTVNGCESPQATLNVYSKSVPSPPSLTSVTLCQGAQGQFSTSIIGALWYTSATGGVGSAQPPTLNSQAAGDQVVYVTQTVNGCESSRAAVKATVYAIPTAPTFQVPVPLCQYATATALTAVGQSLTWYDQSGKLNGAPVPETSVSGTKSYSVSQKVNGCESPRTQIDQVIRVAPATPTATSVRFCVGELPRSLTATGSTIKWYTTITGGTSTSTSPAFLTETPSVLTFYVTQTDNNNCESLRLPISVSVVAPPAAPTVNSSQVVCQFAKVSSLTASPNTGLVWQGSGINGISDIAPTPATTQPATYTYLVSQKAGTCTSIASSITFTVRKLPDPPKVVSPATFCIGQTSSVLSATADGPLTWYTNVDHSGSSSSQIVVNTNRASATTFYVTQTDNFKCESQNSILDVRVSTKATARLTGDGDIYPGDSTAVRVRLTGDGPWSFTNWNKQVINTSDSLYVKWERPAATRSFAITNLTSACGVGDILNIYTLLVRTPLGNQAIVEPVLLKAYPNPTTGDIIVDWSSPVKQDINLQILNSEGKIIRQVTRESTNVLQTEHFQIDSQPTGQYILQITTQKNGVLSRRVVKH